MRVYWVFLLNILCFSGIGWSAPAAGQPARATAALRLLTVEEPPASYRNQHGEADGFTVAVVKALQRELGEHQPIEIMPEGRALLTAQQDPNVLLFSFSRTPERESRYHWLLPVLQKRWQVVQRLGHPPVRSLDALRRLPAVGVVRGDVREAYLQQQHLDNLVAVNMPLQALQLLQADRVQAIVIDQVELAHLLQQQAAGQPVVEATWTFHQSEVYLLIPRQASPLLVQRWMQAAQRLRQSGELEAIAVSWQQKIARELGFTVERRGHLLLF